MKSLLSPGELAAWAGEGLTLARYFPPSSLAAATAYFEASPGVLSVLSFPRFLDWARGGETLCRCSPRLAAACFRASPRTLTLLPDKLIEVWLEIGLSLYRNTAESLALTCSFFTATPDLLQSVNLASVERLAFFLNRLAESSIDQAKECLTRAPDVLSRIGKKERRAFLALALFLAKTRPEEAASYFTRGAEVLGRVNKRQHKLFLSLTERIARTSARRALTFFFDCSQGIKAVDGSLHGRVLNWAETLLPLSTPAAIEFLKNCPELLARFQISGLERWFGEGVALLGRDQEAGLAHFRSSVPGETAGRLQARVDLEQVDRTLLMYAQALAGGQVQLRSSKGLNGPDSDWILPGRPASDGTAIFVPTHVEIYGTEEENFAWYKVAVTHQAGHIEFGTFGLCFQRAAALFSDLRCELPSTEGADLTDIERFLGLFEDAGLAADIFTVTEDTRIDFLLKREYAGITSTYGQVQRDSLSTRPPLSSLPLREALIESLIRFSLDGGPRIVPPVLRAWLESALPILRRVQSPGATVEDSAEATVRLYDIISAIPNIRLPKSPWGVAGSGGAGLVADGAPAEEDAENAPPVSAVEFPYRSAAEVDFRGRFNPELVHLRLKMSETPLRGEPSLAPLSPEMLKQLAGKEIRLGEILHGEHPSSGLFATDLPAGARAKMAVPAGEAKNLAKLWTGGLTEEVAGEEGKQFFYDEWDFESCSYLPRWCRVREKVPAEGNSDFFRDTLARHSSLVTQIRKQFEMLSPDSLKKLNRLNDGDGLDLNAVVDAVVERKAGYASGEKVYWKKRRLQRDVAAVFLLDMSSSTASPIEDADDDADEGYFDWYFERMGSASWSRARSAELVKTPRRVIDVAKESVVLMITALETIGDCYGIYGFSGHGRENVELLVIKAMDERFSNVVERRIDGIRPMRATRMGPAIRHATSKLEAREASTKILFLISDGYPQDKGYGRDSNDKEYALRDTRMALIEAKRSNIVPFCLTIDVAGYDYLEKMSAGIGYEVVNNVESLPRRLPLLYRRLTGL